jgi:hypothetical protein
MTIQDAANPNENVIGGGQVVEPKLIGFDFDMDSFVSVQAPVGTDPDTLTDQALALFSERIKSKDAIVCFAGNFDPDYD